MNEYLITTSRLALKQTPEAVKRGGIFAAPAELTKLSFPKKGRLPGRLQDIGRRDSKIGRPAPNLVCIRKLDTRAGSIYKSFLNGHEDFYVKNYRRIHELIEVKYSNYLSFT